jgi:hypothetical protein
MTVYRGGQIILGMLLLSLLILSQTVNGIVVNKGDILSTNTTAISPTMTNSTTTTSKTSTPRVVDGVNYYYLGFVITLIVLVTVIIADKLRERGTTKFSKQ